MGNLTRLAPDIVVAILETHCHHITLFDLAVDPLALLDEERERIESGANFGNRI
jgi:hypothetical protein